MQFVCCPVSNLRLIMHLIWMFCDFRFLSLSNIKLYGMFSPTALVRILDLYNFIMGDLKVLFPFSLTKVQSQGKLHIYFRCYNILQSSRAKLAALPLIGFNLLHNDTRNKSLGCFEKFRKLSIWWALSFPNLVPAILR